MRCLVLLLAFAGIGVWGCCHPSKVAYDFTDREDMLRVLCKELPKGTPISKAKRVMEHQGFKCTPTSNDVFVERTALNDPGIEHEGIDFLYCARNQRQPFSLMVRIDRVALVVQDGEIADILTSSYIDGP